MSEEFNCSGYHYSVAVRGEHCTSCTFCAVMCPDVCIEVYK
jgi:2-oxoglutarate ferredoxin oxidoreductase subunit delta